MTKTNVKMRHASKIGNRRVSGLSAIGLLLCTASIFPYGSAVARDTVVKAAPKVSTRVITTPKTSIDASSQENLVISASRRIFKFAKAQRQADSATRLTAQDILRKGIVSVRQLQTLAPNVTIQSMMGTASTNFWIRGIGFNDYTQNNMSSVLTYVDDVAFPYSTMSNGMLFDLQDVEIDPGPIGTKHGLNDTGGAVNIRTANPTDKWHAGISEDIASYARNRVQGYVSGPITDKLAFRVAAQNLEGGGYQWSPANHTHLGDADETALRAKLRWRPDAKTEIMLSSHWVQDDSQVVTGRPILNFLSSQTIPSLGFQQADWDLRPGFAHLIGRSASMKPSEHNTFWGAEINASRDLNFAVLRSISAFESEREGEYTDQDGTSRATGDQYRNVVANAFSQELQLASPERNRLQWQVGMTYTRSRMSQQFFNDFTDYVPLRGYYSETSFKQNQQSFNQYAHVSYRLPHHITVFGGLSHEADDRQLLNMRTVHFGVSDVRFANSGAAANQFSGTLGIQWQALEKLQLYYKMSKGFKPGGFSANNTILQQQLQPFKPESLLAYEVGFKSDPIRDVLRLNGAAFYYDYHGQQMISNYLVPNYGPVGMYVNIPKSDIWGIEFNAELHPLKHLYIRQNFGYERGQYKIFQALNASATNAYFTAHQSWVGIYNNYAGTDSGIPKLTLNGSADYETQFVRNYTIDGGLDWSYRGSQAMAIGGVGAYRLPDYFLMGAHLTVRPTHGWWSATVYASNLLNRQYYLASGSNTTTYFRISGEPRYIGGRLTAHL